MSAEELKKMIAQCDEAYSTIASNENCGGPENLNKLREKRNKLVDDMIISTKEKENEIKIDELKKTFEEIQTVSNNLSGTLDRLEKIDRDRDRVSYFPSISEAESVKIFTEESSGVLLPERPALMSNAEVHFIIKMVLDEMMELYATVAEPYDAKISMIKMIEESKLIPKETGNTTELIAAQADAFVDANYYMLNAAAKKGVNVAKIFQLVHGANMAKKDPETNTFLKREDGKILKPKDWKEPNIVSEIERQLKDGAWN